MRTFDEPMHLGEIDYIVHHVSFTKDLPVDFYFYLQFPGLHLDGAFLAQVAGLPLTDARCLLALVIIMVYTVSLYLFNLMLFQNCRVATLASFIIMMSSWDVVKTAGILPRFAVLILYVLTFWLTLRERVLKNSAPRVACLIILFSGMVSMHFPTSLYTLFLLLVLSTLDRTKNELGVNFRLICPLAIILVIWVSYMASYTMYDVLRAAELTILNYFKRPDPLWVSWNVSSRLVGNDPIWANGIRIFWLAFTWVGSISLLIAILLKNRRLCRVEFLLATCFLSVIALSGSFVLVTPQGWNIVRIAAYGPYFAIPFIIYQLNNANVKRVIPALAFIALALSFPTMLTYNNTASTDAVYEAELNTGYFLSIYKQQTQTMFFLSEEAHWVFARYLFGERYMYEAPVFAFVNSEEYWDYKFSRLSQFQNQFPAERGIIVFSKRMLVLPQHILGINPLDVHWKELLDVLSLSNKIYDNPKGGALYLTN